MTDAPRAPAGLGTEGKRLWKRVVSGFYLEPHHLETLEVAARALDRAAACRGRIDAVGEAVEDRFGVLKAHPLLSAEGAARSLYLRAMKELGLDVLPPGKAGRPATGV